MRIGIDLSTFSSSYVGGVTTYVYGLLEGFQKLSLNHSIVLFSNEQSADDLRERINSNKISVISLPNLPLTMRACRKTLHVLKLTHTPLYSYFNTYAEKFVIEKNCDIIYCPLTYLRQEKYKIPSLVSMHDIQHLHHPEFFSSEELKFRAFEFHKTVTCSSAIQASSRFSKNDFIEHFASLNDSNVFIIPEGVDIEKYSVNPQVDIRKKYNLPQRFLFYPAQLWSHKNHITILKALKKLNRDDIALVLTGAEFTATKAIFDFIKDYELKNVYYLGKVPFEDLITIYHEAEYLIIASLHESSSLPVLEAAAAGTAIITSDIAPLLEMGQNLKINYFPSLDFDYLADLIEKKWDLPNAEEQADIEYNKEAVKKYCWKNIASKYIHLFEKINSRKFKK